jgi:hypothetical protein
VGVDLAGTARGSPSGSRWLRSRSGSPGTAGRC